MIVIGILLLTSRLCHSSIFGSGNKSGLHEQGDWSTSTSGRFTYSITSDHDSLNLEGSLGISGDFIASGGASLKASDGNHPQETICVSGYANTGQWNANGYIGFNSITASGTAPTTSRGQNHNERTGSGSIKVDPNSLTLASGGQMLAFCGSYNFAAGDGMDSFDASGQATAYDPATKTEHNYRVQINSQHNPGGSTLSGTIDYDKMSPFGPGPGTDSHANGCFTTLRREQSSNMFTASGYIGTRTFSATGQMKNGFWMTDSAYAMSGMRVLGGQYNAMCDDMGPGYTTPAPGPGVPVDHKCDGDFHSEGTGPGGPGQGIHGTMSKNGTWVATLPLSHPFPETRISGTYGSGMFQGSGTAMGLMWTANGVYGHNCFHTTSQSLSCSGAINGLQSGYGGCGTVTGNSFTVSGQSNGTHWSAYGTITEGQPMSTINGTLTDGSGKTTSFSASDVDLTGPGFGVQVGSHHYSITAMRFGDTVVMAADSGP